MPSASETQIYQLKVTLKNVKPPVWRRIQVKEDISLHKLHLILQIAMGWFGGHLYQFVLGKRPWFEYYGDPHPEYGDDEMKSAKHIKLNQAAPDVKDKFVYEYDFGDGWEHEIVLEKILEPEKGVHYPVCIAGKRACPPEDCGGPWGYAELLETISNPESEDYEEMMEWISGKFDPEEFDHEGINAGLHQIK